MRKKKKRPNKRTPAFPRVVPVISTSSKTFVDGKTKSRSWRELNKAAREEADGNGPAV